jgi:hypothetical protein
MEGLKANMLNNEELVHASTKLRAAEHSPSVHRMRTDST